MRLPKSISAWLPVAILGTTGTLLTSLAVKSIGNTKGSYPAAVVATLQTEPAGSLILILLILFLVALAWVVYLHFHGTPDPERTRKLFKKSVENGWMERDGVPFCPRCLSEDPPRVVRLIDQYSDEGSEDYWICAMRECRESHFGPRYRANQQAKKKSKAEQVVAPNGP